MARPSPTLERRFLTRPLDTIFGSPVHAAVLRVLRPTQAGATGREIAKLAEIDPHAALNALGVLERAGLVQRRVAGRSHVFVLNRGHHLWTAALEALFAGEHSFREALFHAIGVGLDSSVESAAVFGSCARGEDSLDSDVDLCLIVRDASSREAALDLAGTVSAKVERKFGRHLSPIVFTLQEFRGKFKRKEPLVQAIVAEGVHIHGLSFRRMTHD